MIEPWTNILVAKMKQLTEIYLTRLVTRSRNAWLKWFYCFLVTIIILCIISTKSLKIDNNSRKLAELEIFHLEKVDNLLHNEKLFFAYVYKNDCKTW